MAPRGALRTPAAAAAAASRKGSGRGGCGGNWAWIALAVVVAVVAVASGALYARRPGDPMFTPLAAERMQELPLFTELARQREMLWGTYRPQAYFGVRTRLPQSVLGGLLWWENDAQSRPLGRPRHMCTQEDGLSRYGWTRHDGRSFGEQTIVDHGLELTTSFVKSPDGRDWSVRLSGRARPAGDGDGDDDGDGAEDGDEAAAAAATAAAAQKDDQHRRVSLVYYLGNEGAGSLRVGGGGAGGNNYVSGRTPDLGPFTLQAPLVRSASRKWSQHWFSGTTAHFHNLTEQLTPLLSRTGDLPSRSHARGGDAPSLAALQFKLRTPFQVDLVFTSHAEADVPAAAAGGDDGVPPPAPNAVMWGETLTALLRAKATQFDERFANTFPIALEAGESAGAAAFEARLRFARATFSNLLGGVGYFHGRSVIANPRHRQRADGRPSTGGEPATRDYFAAPLYTAVPSRSFFPRGFMWDEGFHQLLIARWDLSITMDVLGHWLDLINGEGWIPREQILGEEARSRVPAEFVAQHTTNANPPTFFLALEPVVACAEGEGAAAATASRSLGPDSAGECLAFVQRAWPRLQAWYGWFNRTQSGPRPFSYRWRGRQQPGLTELNPKTLTSGLDDYPRASHPSADERHVDLFCWMAMASEKMARIARLAGAPAAVRDAFADTARALRDNAVLNRLHWSEKLQMYADYGRHTRNVRLAPKRASHPSQAPRWEREEFGKAPPSNRFVNQFGYVSLFPFLLRLLDPAAPQLNATLHRLRDPELLWAPYGLRSLAKSSDMYQARNTEHDPPYWRGPVWININYLAAAALQHYAGAEGPFREEARRLHRELVRNVVGNVYAEYRRTGFVWEQYDSAAGNEGRGKGSHPFTGWSALVVSMMAQQYV